MIVIADFPNPLGPLYSFQFIVLLVCAGIYWKLATLDQDASSIVWAGLSAFTFCITWLMLRWGYAGDLFGQLVLFTGITLYRTVHNRGP